MSIVPIGTLLKERRYLAGQFWEANMPIILWFLGVPLDSLLCCTCCTWCKNIRLNLSVLKIVCD